MGQVEQPVEAIRIERGLPGLNLANVATADAEVLSNLVLSQTPSFPDMRKSTSAFGGTGGPLTGEHHGVTLCAHYDTVSERRAMSSIRERVDTRDHAVRRYVW